MEGKIRLEAQEIKSTRDAEKPINKWKLHKELAKQEKRKEQAEIRFPYVIPVKKEALERHKTDVVNLAPENMKTAFHARKFQKKKERFLKGVESLARAEILDTEEAGYLVPDEGEFTFELKQSEIVAAVDIASASKHFNLRLEQYGPYRCNYTENGRYLVLGGRRGHVAAFDWQTKKLLFETSVAEKVRDVHFLHTENMVAVAQRHYTYVYDNTGTELHCVKQMHQVERLQFLPHHFLLVGGSRTSYLHYLDASVGKIVCSVQTRKGPLNVLTANPSNAVIHTGHGDGTVCLWSPNCKDPVVRMLAHPCSIKGLAVDHSGNYMYTTALDRKCRVWDIRAFRQMYAYTVPFGSGDLAVSQRRSVVCAIGNTVQVFNDMHLGTCREPYISHRVSGAVSDLSFVPFEDVLGVGHGDGFSSLVVPGSGESAIDAIRCNPYETKSQKKEREVRQLLDKIDWTMISLDASDINKVDTEALERQIEEAKSILWKKAPAITFEARHKTKGRGGGVNKAKVKQAVKQKIRLERNMQKGQMMKEVFGHAGEKESKGKHVLDRFKKK